MNEQKPSSSSGEVKKGKKEVGVEFGASSGLELGEGGSEGAREGDFSVTDLWGGEFSTRLGSKASMASPTAYVWSCFRMDL